jgi:hypothetical protein
MKNFWSSQPVEIERVLIDPGFRVPDRNVPTDWRKTGKSGRLRLEDIASACRPKASARDVAG